MSQGRAASAKEILYVWSPGGITRVRRTLRSVPGPAVRALPEDAAPDKRRYHRLDLRLPILYKVMGDDASQIPLDVQPFLLAESANISPMGLCLELSEKLPRGATLSIRIHMDKGESFTAVGCVAWTRPSDVHGHFLTGLKFVVVEDDRVQAENHRRLQSHLRRFFPEI
jgi:hypothetical protein